MRLTATTDEFGAFSIENVPAVAERLAVRAEAQVKEERLTGGPVLVQPVSGTVTDVGVITIKKGEPQ